MLKEIVCATSMAFGYHSCPNETPLNITGVPRDGLVVRSLHAGVECGKTHIQGLVEKGGLGGYGNANAAVDIVITRKGKTIRSLCAGLLPSRVPETRQGVPGRSSFGVTLDPLPSDAQITVTPHRQRAGE
jgi:hypothetical protein